jgi:IS5 family transposase
MERKLAEPTLMDATVADLGGPRTAAFFDKCQRLIPWARLAAPLADLYEDNGAGGRPAWPVQLMVKCLMLQKWFNLSDPQLEEQLQDRLSFRRFVGLSVTDDTPDETTFVRFRQRLLAHHHGRTLFDQVLGHLRAQGLVMKSGTLVDATIIEAPLGRARAGGGSTRDREAAHTCKHRRTYHGYKAHLATDRRGLITDFRFGKASESDLTYFDELTAREKTAVYGDSAYRSAERERRLERRGIEAGIIHQRVKGQARLAPADRERNRMLSKIRAFVEHPIAWIKNMGHRRTRYRGRLRNALDFGLVAAAYNLKRSFSLMRCAPTTT